MAAKDVQITLTAIDKASSVIAGIASTAERSFGSIQSVLAGAGMAAPLAGIIKTAYEWGQAVNDLEDATGMAEEDAGKLIGIGKTLGLSAETIQSAFIKMSKSASAAQDAMNGAADGAEGTSNVYSRFKIEILDANRALLPADQILKNIIQRHRELPNGIEKTNMELEIFGKKGAQLNDLLNTSGSEIDRLGAKFAKLGLATSGTSQAWEDARNKSRELGLTVDALGVQLGNQLLPRIIEIVDKCNEWAEQYGKLSDNTKAATVSAVEFAAEAGAFKVLLAGLLPPWARWAAYIYLAVDALNDYSKAANKAKGISPEIQDQIRASLDAAAFSAGAVNVDYSKIGVVGMGDLKSSESATYKSAVARKTDDDRAAKTLKTAVDLASSLSKVRDSSLQQAIDAIDKETAAFRKAKLSEVDIAKYAELAKTKAVRDAIDQRFGPEVAAAKTAILEGRDPYSDVAKAKATHEKDDKATYDAKEYVRNLLGVKLPGETVRGLSFEGNTISQTSRTATNVEIPQARPGQPNIFENYRPAEAGKISITVSPNITVSAITPETRRQIQNEMAEGLEQALGRAYNSQVDARY